MTVNLLDTYKKCGGIMYSMRLNPKRALTMPHERVGNNGFDNINADYILRVNDTIISPEGVE